MASGRVYTSQLALVTAPASATTVLYTSPVGILTSIVDIEVCAGGGAVAGGYFTAGPAGVPVLSYPALASHVSSRWEGRIALLPGQTFTIVNGTGALGVIMTGYLLTLP